MQSFLDGNEGAKFNDTAGFLIDLAERERIDIRDETIPESIVTEYDVIAWQADKFRHSLGDYACSPKKLTFREQPGVWERIAEFKRDFSHYSESEFYMLSLSSFCHAPTFCMLGNTGKNLLSSRSLFRRKYLARRVRPGIQPERSLLAPATVIPGFFKSGFSQSEILKF
jgi:hypothetical protein